MNALAIHHLPDTAKRDPFSQVLARLASGGVFVNADRVDGPTPWHADQYAAAHDRCATLGAQLALLRAGFERVDVAFKRFRFAVYAGYAPTLPAGTTSPRRGFRA